MKRLLPALIDEQAATAVEYALLLGLIVMLLLTSVALVGEKTNGLWSSVETNLTESAALK